MAVVKRIVPLGEVQGRIPNRGDIRPEATYVNLVINCFFERVSYNLLVERIVDDIKDGYDVGHLGYTDLTGGFEIEVAADQYKKFLDEFVSEWDGITWDEEVVFVEVDTRIYAVFADEADELFPNVKFKNGWPVVDEDQ